jgi:hypothetical protein
MVIEHIKLENQKWLEAEKWKNANLIETTFATDISKTNV